MLRGCCVVVYCLSAADLKLGYTSGEPENFLIDFHQQKPVNRMQHKDRGSHVLSVLC